MSRLSHSLSTIAAASVLGLPATAQVVVTTNTTSDTVVAFSPFDGSLVDTDIFPVEDLVQVAAIAVGLDVWVSEQLGDRVVRYDHGGNVLGVIGPTYPGGGFDNIRGMTVIGGTVYVCNDGTANGAPGPSLIAFDFAGNYLSHFLTPSSAPFYALPWQGDVLVSSDAANNDVHRYTLAGASVGSFHNSTSLNFVNQLAQATDGNVWAAGFSSNAIVKLDATSGAILTTIAASGVRGVFELQNGNLLWTNSAGVHVYNGTSSTLVHAGGSYQLNLIPNDVSFHRHFGVGCHTHRVDRSNLFQFFTDVTSAKAALDGNALRFTPSGNAYVANWMPGTAGAMYVAPSVGATVVANIGTGQETFTPSTVVPIPGGVATSWTVSSEGILTANSPGNQGTDASPTLAETADQAGLAFYTWCTQNPVETGSGKVKWEEIANVLYVTFDGVEFSGGTPTLAPSTYQWQIDMVTGEVTMLWLSFSSSNSTTDVLVGCTLAGAGNTPVSQTLSAVANAIVQPDLTQDALTMVASPSPVINPSTVVTYTISNVPEISPGSGAYLSALTLSLNPVPAGIDLTGILANVSGCRSYVATWDLILGVNVTVTPVNPVQFTFSTPTFAPGNTIGAQGVALFDTAFPLLNGENGGFLFSNGVISTTFAQ